ncbi:MAG: hypothetical protein CMQ19_03055 [Gammaproteobacteria bacterium]|nr:hypothetical protein [Gammaproteobacteria bacterium]|tara:strand:+ start:8502 stop:8681 length:180 start_codon:yes stop_codon:yes gene_type:complete
MQIIGGDSSAMDVFQTANRDRQMGTAFTDNLANFRDAGGIEFFFFLNEDLWDGLESFGA